jgi:hypothetical protein
VRDNAVVLAGRAMPLDRRPAIAARPAAAQLGVERLRFRALSFAMLIEPSAGLISRSMYPM